MEIRGEVEAAEFGDKRLTARLVRLAELLAKAPHQSFPKAAGADAALEATYRFLGSSFGCSSTALSTRPLDAAGSATS